MNPRYHAIALIAVLTLAPLTASADCAVVSSDAEGVPVRISCGALALYAVTPAQLARWTEIEDALTLAVADLETCAGQRITLSNEQAAYLARDEALSAQVVDLTAGVLRLGEEVAERHTLVEVVVYVALGVLLAGGSGYAIGALTN